MEMSLKTVSLGGALLVTIGLVGTFVPAPLTKVPEAQFEGFLDVTDEQHVACECAPGFEPNDAGDDCQNIDPCEDGSNICSDGTCRDHPPPALDYACDCDPGYANSETPYDCEPSPCEPITIPNSNIDQVVADPQSSEAVLCDFGYGEDPSFEIDCVGVDYDLSEWFNVQPCDPVSCADLTVLHSSTTGHGGITTDTTTVDCDFGYATSSSTCNFDVECVGIAPGVSEWQTVQDCVPVACPAPIFSHATTSFSEPTVTTETVQVFCDDGYAREGGAFEFSTTCAGSAPCTSDWTDLVDCEPVQCPEVFLDHSFAFEGYTFSGAVTDSGTYNVECHSGYQPSLGPDGDSCNVPMSCVGVAPGEAGWDIQDYCTRVVCPAFSAEHVQDYQQTIYEDDLQEVVSTCADGYAHEGSGFHTSVCGAVAPCESAWTSLPDCQCVPCPPLEVLHSDTSGQNSCTDQTELVTCDDGYCANGDSSFEAVCAGQAPAIALWEAETCEPLSCGVLSIPFSDASGIELMTGEEVEVYCDEGYQADLCMSWMVRCVASGPCAVEWEYADKTCEPVVYDCEGIPNGLAVVDVCGVCDGDGQSCLDCLGTPFGTAVIETCGCDDDVSCRGCDDIPYSGLVFDECGECGGDNSTCAGCDNVPNSGLVFDECGECGGDNSTCAGCDNVPNSGLVFDECGECDGDNSICAGCDNVPNSGLVFDQCGICDGNGLDCLDCFGDVFGTAAIDPCGDCRYPGEPHTCIDCHGHYHGNATLDACNVCDGDNSTCTDCLGVVNGTAVLDQCDVCNGNDDCLDCNGVPFGPDLLDICSVCGGDGTSCLDCFGVAFGGQVIDACGTCGGDVIHHLDCVYDCTGVLFGPAKYDDCNVCNGDNSTCSDCLGVPNGLAELDQCGICNGNDDCVDCHGVPFGLGELDICSVCDGDGTSCLDCNGDAYGGALLDACGTCGGPIHVSTDCIYDCTGELFGSVKVDACGVCDGDNSTCSDCLGVPNGPAAIDVCGICDGTANVITTYTDLDVWSMLPGEGDAILFQVMAEEATIGFFDNFGLLSYQIEMSNTQTIMSDNNGNILNSVFLADILSASEYRSYWADVVDGELRFGAGGFIGQGTVLSHIDFTPADITSIGLRSTGSAHWVSFHQMELCETTITQSSIWNLLQVAGA
jgi:hypothetical protein